jgi:hypothetical protein
MRRQLYGALGVLVGTAVAVPLILWGQLRRARQVQKHAQISQDAMNWEWRLKEPRDAYDFYD